MKYILIIFSTIILFSCKSDYTCTIATDGYEYTTTYENATKKDLESVEKEGYTCVKD